jgi:hypothetical protein
MRHVSFEIEMNSFDDFPIKSLNLSLASPSVIRKVSERGSSNIKRKKERYKEEKRQKKKR